MRFPARLCLGFLLLFLATPAFAQGLPFPGRSPEVPQALQKLGPRPGHRYRVDIITMTPLEAIYGIWGHTSLRIFDGELGRDVIFDWGVFQFDGVFLVRFLKGSPAYLLAARPLIATLSFHDQVDRTVYAQELLMSDDQARALFRKLAINAQPANRTYIYHHYKNNCVTKIRDIADEAAGGSIRARFETRPAHKTFRETSNAYALDVWHWLGINLIQGTTVDKPITAWQEMYLPINFMDYLEEHRQARLAAGEETIVGPKTLIMQGAPPAEASGWVSLPLTVAVLILALFVAPAVWPQVGPLARAGRKARSVWHLGAGFVGLVLAIFWLFTGHDSMINNLNLFAFSPLYLVAPLLVRLFGKSADAAAPRSPQSLMYAVFAALPVTGLLLMVTGLWPQPALAFLLPAAVIQISIYIAHRRGISAGA